MSTDLPIQSDEDLPEPRDVQPLVEALGGLYGAPFPVPPGVDQAVMARARLRLAAPSRRRPRWLVPLATAACLVLAIGLYRQIDRAPREHTAPHGMTPFAGKPQPSPAPSGPTEFREWTGTSEEHSASTAGSPPSSPQPSTAARRTATAALTAPPREDFDRNGRIDILDAFGLARRLEEAAAPGLEWDLNGDGGVDSRDVDLMAMAAVRIAETPR